MSNLSSFYQSNHVECACQVLKDKSKTRSDDRWNMRNPHLAVNSQPLWINLFLFVFDIMIVYITAPTCLRRKLLLHLPIHVGTNPLWKLKRMIKESPDSCFNQAFLSEISSNWKKVDVAHGVRASACATPNGCHPSTFSLSASSNPEQGSQLRRSDCAVSDIFLSVSASLNKQTWQVMQRFDVRSAGCTLSSIGCPRALQPLDKRAPQGR